MTGKKLRPGTGAMIVVRLYKINVETSEQVQLMFGGKKYSSREPRW